MNPIAQPSSSSSSVSHQIGDGALASASGNPVNETALKRRKWNSDSEVEREDERETEMGDLPDEMLLEIFKHLDSKSSTTCRRVNKKFNIWSHEIVRKKSEIWFFCYFSRQSHPMTILENRQLKSLREFNEQFLAMKENPLFARFKFENVEAGAFENEDWKNFFVHFGTTIKSLRLCIKRNDMGSSSEYEQFSEKLGILLSSQLWNLTELGLKFPIWFWLHGDNAFIGPFNNLYPSPFTNEVTNQLPILQIFRVNESALEHCTEFVSGLLHQTTNLKEIAPFEDYAEFRSFKTILYLHSQDKLHCLKKVIISLHAATLANLNRKTLSAMDFKLNHLTIFMNLTAYQSESSRERVGMFLSSVFEKSKDTLITVDLYSVAFLEGFELTKFSKLQKLNLYPSGNFRNQPLPQGLDLCETFPVLQHIELSGNWIHFFSKIKLGTLIPTLEFLGLLGDDLLGSNIKEIADLFPNLRVFKTQYLRFGTETDNFCEVITSIWRYLNKLETLELKVQFWAEKTEESACQMDSLWTGFSTDECRYLRAMSGEVDFSSGYQSVRLHPSILDLQDLRQLTIWFSFSSTPADSFSNRFMALSKQCSFAYMKGLIYNV